MPGRSDVPGPILLQRNGMRPLRPGCGRDGKLISQGRRELLRRHPNAGGFDLASMPSAPYVAAGERRLLSAVPFREVSRTPRAAWNSNERALIDRQSDRPPAAHIRWEQ